MRRPKKLQPRVEMMESKLLMSADALASAAVAHQVSKPLPPVKVVVPLDGDLTGTYTSPQTNPDVGKTYHLTGSGPVSPLGHLELINPSQLHSVGFIHKGFAGGTLTLSDGKGDTLTLKLTAEKSQSGPANLPTRFNYVVVKGTGKFLHDTDTGKITVDLTPSKLGSNHGHFTIEIESSHKHQRED